MSYVLGTTALEELLSAIEKREKPVVWPVGIGALEAMEVGPGRIVLLGGAPNIGKTALVMQLVVDALRTTEELRALVVNVEMSCQSLVERQIARFSGVTLDTIRSREHGEEDEEKLSNARATLRQISDRLCFVTGPFDMATIDAVGSDFNADLLVVDYLQRICATGDTSPERTRVNACMDWLRRHALDGMGILVVGALSRQRDAKGRSSYNGELSMAAFRESSELEYGADSVYVMVPGKGRRIVLRNLKERHREKTDIELEFDGALQAFYGVNRG